MDGLILSRKPGEQIIIGENIVLTIDDIERDRVRLRFTAPRDIEIDRAETREKKRERMESNLANAIAGNAPRIYSDEPPIPPIVERFSDMTTPDTTGIHLFAADAGTKSYHPADIRGETVVGLGEAMVGKDMDVTVEYEDYSRMEAAWHVAYWLRDRGYRHVCPFRRSKEVAEAMELGGEA